MDNFIVLGASSRLASYLKKQLPSQTIYLDRKQCDITSIDSLEKVFKQFTFDYIINCAAITDIHYCESNQKECFDTNTLGVVLLNKYCQKYKKKLIHISSDYAINPVNAYGASKYLSEKLVDESALVIRTNFYDKATFIIHSLLFSKPIAAYENVTFNPISANRLAEEIFKQKDKEGIVNIFSAQKISYYDFAIRVCKEFDIQTSLVNRTHFDNTTYPRRPLSSYVKPDINVEINQDLHLFKQYLAYGNK